MDKIERITKNTFSMGSIRDAAVFLEICVKNAFPDFHFRGIEVVRFLPSEKKIEGKSWNHSFSIEKTDYNNSFAWKVICVRASEPDSEKEPVFLDTEKLMPIE